MNLSGVLRVGAGGLAFLSVACAGIIYDAGGPASPFNGPEITVHQVAAGFSLSQTSTVTGFNFWSVDFGAPLSGYAGSLGWWIYSDDAGSPGAAVAWGTASGFSRQNVASETILGNSAVVYRNQVGLGSLDLNAGNYWLGIKNGPPSLSTFNGFLWTETTGIAPQSLLSQTQTSTGWIHSGLSLAFQVEGTAVPEPATASLLIGGLGAIVLAARRKRRL